MIDEEEYDGEENDQEPSRDDGLEQTIKAWKRAGKDWEWTKQLDISYPKKKGAAPVIMNTLNNQLLILDNDPRMGGCYEYNELKLRYVRRRALPNILDSMPEEILINPGGHLDPSLPNAGDGHLLEDHHLFNLRNLFEAKFYARDVTRGGYRMSITKDGMREAVQAHARANAFHPIKEYFEDLGEIETRLETEMIGNRVVVKGELAIDRLFVDYLLAEDTIVNREAARLIMLGAVFRVMEPGCEFKIVPVIEGCQDIGKSGFCKVLAKSRWFGNMPSKASLDDPKKMMEATGGIWIMEAGELHSFKREDDVAAGKDFISRTVDKARHAYASYASEEPRQCVIIATTNESEYLRDRTGNVRFVPVRSHIKEKSRIDFRTLLENIDGLWREAYNCYLAIRRDVPSGVIQLDFSDAAKEMLDGVRQSRMVVDYEVDEYKSRIIEATIKGGWQQFPGITCCKEIGIAGLGMRDEDYAKGRGNYGPGYRIGQALEDIVGYSRAMDGEKSIKKRFTGFGPQHVWHLDIEAFRKEYLSDVPVVDNEMLTENVTRIEDNPKFKGKTGFKAAPKGKGRNGGEGPEGGEKG